MTITYHTDMDQGSVDWLAARCGLLTASEMKLIVAPPPEPETRIKKNGEPYKQREWDPIASSDKERAHLYELLGQRITKYVEPHYISDDMLRGHQDEIDARILYAEKIAPVESVGFITNDKWGFTIGYSPDGLVGSDGAIECKSRRQKYQIETIVECMLADTIPPDFVMQVQTGLLVSERKWIDFLSYHGGLHMAMIRVFPDEKIQAAIIDAASAFEERLAAKMRKYTDALALRASRLFPTERTVELDIVI